MKLSKEKWQLAGYEGDREVYACMNSQGATCWYINHAGRSEAEVNNGGAVPPLLAFPSDEPLGFRPLAWSPVPDESEAPDEQPKVDPYEAHRMAYPDERALAEDMATRGRTYGATARLLRGLEGEKVRERVKPWPHPARNPR